MAQSPAFDWEMIPTNWKQDYGVFYARLMSDKSKGQNSLHSTLTSLLDAVAFNDRNEIESPVTFGDAFQAPEKDKVGNLPKQVAQMDVGRIFQHNGMQRSPIYLAQEILGQDSNVQLLQMIDKALKAKGEVDRSEKASRKKRKREAQEEEEDEDPTSLDNTIKEPRMESTRSPRSTAHHGNDGGDFDSGDDGHHPSDLPGNGESDGEDDDSKRRRGDVSASREQDEKTPTRIEELQAKNNVWLANQEYYNMKNGKLMERVKQTPTRIEELQAKNNELLEANQEYYNMKNGKLMERAKQTPTRIEELQAKNNELLEANQEYYMKNEKLQEQVKHFLKFEGDEGKLEADNLKLFEANQELKMKNDELQEQVKQFSKFAGQDEDREAEWLAQKEQWREREADWQSDEEQWQAEEAAWQAKEKELQADIKKRKGKQAMQAKDFKEREEEYRAHISKLKDEKKNLKANVSALTGNVEIEQMVKRTRTLEDEASNLKSEAAGLQKIIEKIPGKCSHCKPKLDKLRRR